MGKKIRLTTEQKVWHENLEWYLKNKVCWAGRQNLKEAVLDGNLAVLSINGEVGRGTSHKGEWKPMFENVICCEDMDTAWAIVRYNPSSNCCVVNLNSLMVMLEVKRPWVPDLTNLIERHHLK
jgi:hypothetical protein